MSRIDPARERVARRAHAKINLALSVGPPIQGGLHAGYHPIASWFSCIDAWDDVRLARRDEPSSVYEIAWASDAPRPTPIDWPLEKDLAVRAHRLMEEAGGRALPVSLRIEKRIPVGGGLGGGSSDAAAALLGVNTLFDLQWPLERLRSLSVKLGSDVAFFLDDAVTPRAARVSGLGDRIERVRSLAWPVLVIFPAFGCPTGPVYKAYDRNPVPLRENDVSHLVRQSLERGAIDSRSLFNDLAEPACIVQPQLRDLIAGLSGHAQRPVHVTGSGSTLFVLGVSSTDETELATLGEAIRSHFPQVAVLCTRLI
jgi:4-diphosphocytidyl-2-C-methyl-D-erythritol kinase